MSNSNKLDQETSAPQSLKDQGSLIMEEARTIAPGIQAIFGFQLVAVFNQRFSEVLSPEFQKLHLLAIFLIVVAMGCLLSPAAYNRLGEPGIITKRFVELATFFLSMALGFLTAGIALDCFLISHVVTHMLGLSLFFGGFIFVMLSSLWFIFPFTQRMSKSSLS